MFMHSVHQVLFSEDFPQKQNGNMQQPMMQVKKSIIFKGQRNILHSYTRSGDKVRDQLATLNKEMVITAELQGLMMELILPMR
jgi:hypothetical protein